MANFPSVTAAGAFESTAVQDAIKTLAEQAVSDRLAALEQDTGWRDITDELINGWTAAQVLVRRDGHWGHLQFVSLDGTQATDTYFAVGLTGFLAGGQNLPLTIGTAPATIWVRNSADRLSLPTTSPVSSTTTQVSQYLGDIPIPVSPPGTPA